MRKRLPPEVFEEVFQFVLRIAVAKDLVAGKTVGVDSTMLEANAAMKRPPVLKGAGSGPQGKRPAFVHGVTRVREQVQEVLFFNMSEFYGVTVSLKIS